MSDPIAERARARTAELVALDASENPVLWREFERNEATCNALLVGIARTAGRGFRSLAAPVCPRRSRRRAPGR